MSVSELKPKKPITLNLRLLQISVDRDRLRDLAAFFLFILFAVGHIPILYLGSEKADAIGLFDVWALVLFAAIIYRNTKFSVTPSEMSFLKLYGVFLVFVSLNFFLYLPRIDNLAFAAGLWLKQFEYLVIGIISTYYIKKIDKKTVLHGVYLSIIFIAVYGFYKFFFGTWYRLGIPFAQGISPNPAGFMLGILLIVMLLLLLDESASANISKFLFWGIFLLGYAALIMTASRTNNIGFFLIFLFYIFRRFRKRIFIVVFIIGILVAALYISATFILENTTAGGTRGLFFNYLINPDSVIQDSSFKARYTELWVRPFEKWDSNWFTRFFGIGIGNATTVDNLYFAVLYNMGIIGFILYFSIYLYLLFIGDFRMRLILVFILINGIAAETALNSFRSMQVAIFYIMFAFHYFKRSDLEYHIKQRSKWKFLKK